MTTWPNSAAANPAIASLLQSTRPAGRVAEPGALGRTTRMPKFHVLLLIAIGLLVFASISIAPNLGRKPVLAADGAEVRKPDGSVLTEPDSWGHIKSNWFGYAAALLSMVFFVLAIARLIWSGWLRIQRHRHENRDA